MKREEQPLRAANGVGPGAGLSARQAAIARELKRIKQLAKGNKKP